jgi:hypothetical protein
LDVLSSVRGAVSNAAIEPYRAKNSGSETMKMTMHTIPVIVGVALGLVHGAAAAGFEGKWEAMSTTAISITGNIQVASDAITFGEGTRLGMSAVGSAKGTWGDLRDSGEGLIYRLEPPADPPLLQGNRLCRMPGEKVTYVVLAPFDDGLSLLVYTGDAKPTPDASACASYNYVP